MRKVEYKVGRDGYYTYCSTLESARKQAREDKDYVIKTVLVNVEESKATYNPLKAQIIRMKARG